MKKIGTTKDRIKNKHKKDIFQKHKYQNPKPRSPMNSQHIHNALTNQKSSAASFKDVKTEETFSSQDQKLVETTILRRQLFSDQKLPQSKSASATIANPVELMNGTIMNTSR